MSIDDATQFVAQIHDAGTRLVLAVTGGGSEAISSLFSVPGASRSMLLAAVPYSDAALIEWLDSQPEQFCSPRTARAMAMVAYEKARKLAPAATRVAGIGCTASLASDRPKRSPHRFFIATQTADATTSTHVELEKGRRTRGEEEHITATAILNEIAATCTLADRLPSELAASEHPDRVAKIASPDWQALLGGSLDRLCIGSCGPPRALFPGAFNPIHVGHRRMAEIASRMLGTPVAWEISIVNVDKPPLDFIEIDARVGQFAPGESVWLTRAPTFVEKAAVFPGVTFVVGTDTMTRIAETRYYQNSFPKMLAAIEGIATAGCRFLVFGRQTDGTFRTLNDLNLPPSLLALCDEVPETEFREDVSSTELRQQSDNS